MLFIMIFLNVVKRFEEPGQEGDYKTERMPVFQPFRYKEKKKKQEPWNYALASNWSMICEREKQQHQNEQTSLLNDIRQFEWLCLFFFWDGHSILQSLHYGHIFAYWTGGLLYALGE